VVVLPSSIDYGKVTLVTAEASIRAQQASPVPIVPIWMSDRLGPAFHAYVDAGMVPARTAGKAVKAVRRWIEYGRWRREPHHLEWSPWPTMGQPGGAGQPLSVTESEAKAWLARHGVPVPASALAASREAAIEHARRIGFPVVAKVASAAITHKTEVGGVRLGLTDADAVGRVWDEITASVAAKAPGARVEGLLIERMAPAGGVETFIGVSRDPVFGHVLTFGLGGIYVEVFKDVSRRLLPLQPEEAQAMIREITSFALLDGARGRPKADVAALADLLLKVSDFVGANAQRIDELDLNPVWVGPVGRGVQVLDAVIIGREAAPR
jgi:acetate---CoA ligase (ADP-forming)